MNSRTENEPIPWHAYFLLFRPVLIQRRLVAMHEAGLIERRPTFWQVELGVLRMWERVFLRFDSIGTSSREIVRPTWRARLLKNRLIRAPFLLWYGAISPWDHSGLGSSPKRMIRHLLAAHHDEFQFVYDLEILRLTPEAIEELTAQTRAVVENDTKWSQWLKDLTVFEGYHQSLLTTLNRLANDEEMLPDGLRSDPDLSFRGYIDWCCQQPRTPMASWKRWRASRASGCAESNVRR